MIKIKMNKNYKIKSIDPVLMSVLANRMDGIIREMTHTILKTARSGVINSARDFSCAICTGEGELFAVAEGLPIHIFGSDMQAKCIVDLHQDIAEGDCYLHNDPYTGGTHAADHTFLVPVFFEGDHVFTAVAKAHQADCGNSLPTTYMSMAKDVYEEGALIFPTVRIQRDFKMVADVVRMMEKRIRVPSQWYGDFLSGIGAARIAEKQLIKMCKKYGLKTIKAFISQWLNYSEQRMKNAITNIPDGNFTDEAKHDSTPFLPNGIPLQVSIEINNKKKMVTIDLRNNIDSLECGYNQSEATAVSAVMAGLFNCLESDVPKNAGSFRRVNVLLREGCVTGIPRFPSSCSVATTNVSDRMVNLVGHAFSQLGNKYGLAEGAVGLGVAMSVVSGTDPRFSNNNFVNQLHLSANGGPASALADGWITFGLPVCAGLIYRDSVEVDELKHPMEVRQLSLISGTGGAGRKRGAPAMVIDFVSKSENFTIIYPGDGQEFAPRGAVGGEDGTLAERWVFRKDGSNKKLGNAQEVKLGIGDMIRGIDCSGGGYGFAFEREANLVLEDVVCGFETIDRAKNTYGVVVIKNLITNNFTIDQKKTSKIRNK
tara:strand:+ start:8114 stop:9907 length:1794 start_codon:yes stop_codon:yes gene_type:complete